MVPVVPALVVFATQASSPRYFTNAENVRRIAAGKRFVAFATSGGVRVFERATEKWRVYTQNDGLPTHNIHDVVFDKANPNTLWVLCGAWGDWASEQPEPNLRLVTLDLASGKVVSVAPPTPAPRTARMGYPYFLDYRLSLSESWAFVFTDKGAALAWDRAAKKWTREVSVEANLPRASHYPGHAESMQRVGSSNSMLAFYVQTKALFIYQSVVAPSPDGGQPTITNRPVRFGDAPGPYILLYNRQTGRSTRHSLGFELLGRSTDVVPGVSGKPPSIVYYGWPLQLLPDTRPGSVLIESVTRTSNSDSVKTDYRVLHRVAPNLKEPVQISREKITREQSIALQRQQIPRGLDVSRTANAEQIFTTRLSSGSPLVFWTDFLLDGNTLWVTGYNDPGRQRSGGIARLDLTTGKWDAPKPTTTGIVANFTSIGIMHGRVHSFGQELRSYDPKTEEFRPQEYLAEDPYLANILVPDPRAEHVEGGLIFDEWIPFRVLGQGRGQSLVFGPSEPTRRFTRDVSGRLIGPTKRGPDAYFLLDVPNRKLTPLDQRGLEGLQPKAAGFTTDGFFFLAEERAPGERRGAPVVICWNTKTGARKRYPEALFREVSVSALRLAGGRQQSDLKKRQQARSEQLRRNPPVSIPPIELRPVGQFLSSLSTRFLSAAGTTWLQLDQQLFRYDARQDTWLAEGLADSLSPEGELALWKQAGPESWRFEDFAARRLRGEVSRWSAEKGWQKLDLGESARQAGYGVLFHDEALWLTGVGALRLPRSAWVFQN